MTQSPPTTSLPEHPAAKEERAAQQGADASDIYHELLRDHGEFSRACGIPLGYIADYVSGA